MTARHSKSAPSRVRRGESAATRAVVVLVGLALSALALALAPLQCARSWGRWAAMLHTAFGLFMVLAAAYSTRPWVAEAAFDRTEDALHSVAASAMGFAFALGVVAQAMHRQRTRGRWLIVDVIAVGAAVIIPLSMSVWPEFSGVYQRGMFAIAYLWYGVEAVRLPRS